ncbi:MAG: 16S rRNA (adenine(1518)-N(6)/adenine(1519)-N(6))-dimethyltransferase RsmA [Gammaproteobacteria bacterium]
MARHRPRKRFGQNFLEDSSVIAQLLTAINPQPNEHLVEIGPGTGALTEPLLARCDHLDVVEIDRDLAAFLKSRFAHAKNLNVHCADALDVNFAEFPESGKKIRVIGNLPYNISTPLLFHLLDQRSPIQDMHFMLQKEVVERICASPGTKDFGKLSIMLQLVLETEKCFEVSARSFRPMPKVDSAFIRLIPRPSPLHAVTDIELFRTLVTQAFSRRRKTLKNALCGLLSAEDIASLDVNPTARPENIEIADFARLSNLFAERNRFSSRVPPGTKAL